MRRVITRALAWTARVVALLTDSTQAAERSFYLYLGDLSKESKDCLYLAWFDVWRASSRDERGEPMTLFLARVLVGFTLPWFALCALADFISGGGLEAFDWFRFWWSIVRG